MQTSIEFDLPYYKILQFDQAIVQCSRYSNNLLKWYERYYVYFALYTLLPLTEVGTSIHYLLLSICVSI